MDPGDSCTPDRGSPLSYPLSLHYFLTNQLLIYFCPYYVHHHSYPNGLPLETLHVHARHPEGPCSALSLPFCEVRKTGVVADSMQDSPLLLKTCLIIHAGAETDALTTQGSRGKWGRVG